MSQHESLQQTLWRVSSAGMNHERRGTRYWWINDNRYPATCVFQMTLAGAMVYEDAQGQRLVKTDSAMITRHGDASAYGLTKDCPGPYDAIWLCLDGEGLHEHWGILGSLTGGVMELGQARQIEKQARTLASYALQTSRVDPIVMARAAHQFVLQLLDQAYAQRLVSLSPVEIAIEKLLHQPCYPWSLKALADEAGVSREHMSRVFREKMGQSPARFLNEKRTDRARLLLKQAQMPLAEIAQQAGFTDMHTFIRQMKQCLGMSPGKWRDAQKA